MAKSVAVAQGWECGNRADFGDVLYRAGELPGNSRLRDLRNNASDLHVNCHKRKRHLKAMDIGEGLKAVAELLELLAPLTGLDFGGIKS